MFSQACVQLEGRWTTKVNPPWLGSEVNHLPPPATVRGQPPPLPGSEVNHLPLHPGTMRRRAICILLECILVSALFYCYFSKDQLSLKSMVVSFLKFEINVRLGPDMILSRSKNVTKTFFCPFQMSCHVRTLCVRMAEPVWTRG